MQIDAGENPELINQDAYDDLMTTIEASERQLNLLITVCDDSPLRQELMR